MRGLKVSLLGLAFKPDTDDMRESLAIPIAAELLARGAIVSAYDPVAREAAKRVMPADRIRFVDTLEHALGGADASVLVTRWDEFNRIPDLLVRMPGAPLLVDGRRMLDKRRIARYAGIGLSE